VNKPEHEARCRQMGITDFKKVYRSKDLAPGKSIISRPPASPTAR